MIETVPCSEGCGALLLDFDGTGSEPCPECLLARHRTQVADSLKAREWDEAMAWLDQHEPPTLPYAPLLTRLEEFSRRQAR